MGAGAAFAAAVLSKQPAGWWLLPLALQIVVAHRGRRWRKQLGGCVMGTMGFAIGAGFALGVCLAYFAFYDSLYAFYDWVYLRNLVYARISWRQVHFHWSVMGLAFHTLLDKLMTPRAVPITVGMLFLAWMLLSRRSWLAAVTLLWCITSLAASSMGIAVHDHYLVFTQLALAMVVGVMFDWMYGRSALQWRAPGVAILSATILSALLFSYDINGVYRRLNGGKSTPKYTQEVIRLAQIVREHAAPDDRMFAFGDPFDLLFYAEMKPAGRYIYYPGAQLRTNPNDYMEEVERSIPRFIYIGADTYGPFMAEDKSIRGMLKRYLDEHYELWLDGGFGRVYQRRQPDNLRKSKRPGRSIPASETS